MRQYVVTASEMKRYDANTIEKYRIPSLVLMERAALATVEEMIRVYGNKPCRVLVAAGCGNNGGDGLAVGRLLMLQGYEVTCVLTGSREKCTADTMRQIDILDAYGVAVNDIMQDREYDIVNAGTENCDGKSPSRFSVSDLRDALQSCDIVIDALFGVGLSRPVEGICADVIRQIDEADKFVCSIDIPSGIDADTGAVRGCAVRADLTVTYGFRKLGHILYPGADYGGELVCRRMGIDERSFLGEKPRWYTYTGTDSRVLVPRRKDGNKGTFGKVLVIAGCGTIAGAALLAAKSVLRVGSGMVKVVTAKENRDALLQYVPEAMLLTYPGAGECHDEAALNGDPELADGLRKAEAWADCILIGPGIGTDSRAYELLRFALLQSRRPLIIDADGLNLLAEHGELKKAVADCGDRGRTVILTPHLGEFARLYGCSVSEAGEHLTEYPDGLADSLRCIVVCKDARTVVTRGKDAQSYVNTTGNSGMATAGSGDVLAGMIAGLTAQGMSGVDAAAGGVYLHGVAGDLAAAQETQVSMTASDIIEHIRDAVILQEREER